MNFIEQYKMSPDICDNLVSYFKNNTEYKRAGHVGGGDLRLEIKKSTDVCFYNGSNDKRIKQFFKALSGCVQSYCKKHNVCHYVKTDDLGNNIHYYKPGEGFFKNHYERDAIISARRELVYMVYLNTLTDKGGTIFPVQKKTITPVKGKTVIWPAAFTHPHRGEVSPTQEKYIATGWLLLQ